MSEQHKHYSGTPLGAVRVDSADKRGVAINEALSEWLKAHPEVHRIDCQPEELVAFVVVPIAHRSTPEGPLYAGGLVLYMDDDADPLPHEAIAGVLQDARRKWYAYANADVVNVLDAFVSGDISRSEVESLTGLPWHEIAHKLGVPILPTHPVQLAGVLAMIRAKLAE
ncbi:hypothetical protein [Nocardia phage NBR1]|uniref:hypothetical protein n=1 Tax=Nocardia phage NBR1 TaxID=1109711 RepID=UPI00023EEE16|nr:hypothetical protein NoPhNBR1_gp66 [Nocardia phage NBR1]AEV52279.1 hypothetical protein [Nocardia phage NBR1]